MWKQKLGISLGNHYTIPTEDVAKLVKQVGFEAISPVWEADLDLRPLVETARACGLALQSLHAPFTGSARMWDPDPQVSEPSVQELLASLEACKKYEIPVLVVHTWIGFENIPAPTEEGLGNYARVVGQAAKYGIQIAFENTEGEDHFFALMDHFAGNDAVGFCWDSGHEMCYNHSADLLGKYGDRLIMTHINDNLGISRYDGETYWTDDLHLLPFDGVADWDYNGARLARAKHLEYLNFELSIYSKPGRHENDCYEAMSLEQYFTEAYKRACRVAYKMLGRTRG